MTFSRWTALLSLVFAACGESGRIDELPALPDGEPTTVSGTSGGSAASSTGARRGPSGGSSTGLTTAASMGTDEGTTTGEGRGQSSAGTTSSGAATSTGSEGSTTGREGRTNGRRTSSGSASSSGGGEGTTGGGSSSGASSTTGSSSSTTGSSSQESSGGTASAGTRNWYENPGGDGSFWVLPFQTGAQWLTSGDQITLLRNGKNGSPTGVVNLNFYSPPWVIGQASDPLVTVTDNVKTIQVHVPLGTASENMDPGDNSLGGTDATQPYLDWSCNNAIIDGNSSNTVQDGSTIACTYLLIADGAGPVMMDAVTGLSWESSDNCIGTLQDYDLTQANADSSYVIQHMLQVALDTSQMAPDSDPPAWPAATQEPLGTGSIPEGTVFGIPADVPMPQGMSRGFNLLWTNAQQFGWLMYNASGAGALTMSIHQTDPANADLAYDIDSSLSQVMAYICILQGQTDVSNMKGMVGGVRSDAFPAPPLLDYSPTNGQEVLPSTFGAWWATTQGQFYDTLWQ